MSRRKAKYPGERPYSTRSAVLQCRWSSWSVIDDGVLRLDMPEGQCCSIDGAIQVAQAMCPGVFRIDAYSGGVSDVTYINGRDGWKAYENVPRHFREWGAA